MPRLSHREFDRLSNFLLDLYAFRDHETFVDHVLGSLHALIPCERISYNEMDLQHHQAYVKSTPDDSRVPLLNPIFAKLMHQHPIVQHLQRHRNKQTHAFQITDFLNQREFERLALYQEFYRKLDITHQLAINVDGTTDILIPFAFNRHKSDFAAHERLFLNLLRPHLAQAYRNAKAVSRLKTLLPSLNGVLTVTGLAALLVDRNGTIQWATDNAVEHLRSYCKIVPPGQLPPLIGEWFRSQMATQVESTQRLALRHPLILQREYGKLSIRLLKERHEWWIIMEEHRDEINQAALDEAGLSRREAEVLRWVAQGKTNDEIALVLGVRLATVKKHLERIYIKLGVETRMAAVARAKEICVHALD
ncbi:MAG: hypothetical protein H8K08_00845 [Nitrospira sp.]|nr:hypothetical protein [Nitrospira sp.]